VHQALHEDRTAKELQIVEELLTQIAKDELGVYGIKETEQAVQAGAVKHLLISDKLIHKAREKGTFERIDALMKMVDSIKAEITVVASENDGGKKLDGLGGIGALLRYKI